MSFPIPILWSFFTFFLTEQKSETPQKLSVPKTSVLHYLTGIMKFKKLNELPALIIIIII